MYHAFSNKQVNTNLLSNSNILNIFYTAFKKSTACR